MSSLSYKIIIRLQIYMKLTNTFLKLFSDDQSHDFSRYFVTDSKISPQNFSCSQNTESLLLETTEIDTKKAEHSIIKPLKDMHEDNQILNKSNFLLEDLYSHLQITLTNSNISKDMEKYSKKNVDQLHHLCKNLVITLKNLEDKVQKIQSNEKRSKITCSLKSSPENQSKEFLISQSYASSKTNSCKCEQSSKIALNSIYQFVGITTKLQLYKEEIHKLKQEILRLQIMNEDNKKHIRKCQIDNIKMKQLIKQYQFCMRKDGQKRETVKIQQIMGRQFKKNKEKRVYQVLSQQKYDRNRAIQQNFLLSRDSKQKYKHNFFQNKSNIKTYLAKDFNQHNNHDYLQKEYIHSSPLTPNPCFKNHPKPAFNQKTQYKSSRNHEFKQHYDQELQKQKTFRNIIKLEKTCLKQKKKGLNESSYFNGDLQSKYSKQMKMLKKAKSTNNLDGRINRNNHRYYPFQQLLQQQFELKENNQFLQEIQTMSSLPDRKKNIGTNPSFNKKPSKNVTLLHSSKSQFMKKF